MEQTLPEDLLVWIRNAQRLMRSIGGMSGWKEQADKIDSILATSTFMPVKGYVLIGDRTSVHGTLKNLSSSRQMLTNVQAEKKDVLWEIAAIIEPLDWEKENELLQQLSER